MKRLVLFLALLACGRVWARGADGTLDLVRTPNDGMPALVAPAQSFEATFATKGPLQLIAADGAARPLSAEWTELPGGGFRAACAVAANVPPGAYALEIAAEGRSDRNERAVYVLESFPESYVVAHVTDTHVGREGADATLRTILAKVNEARPAFALITGDLTDQGTPEQFRLFLDTLKSSVVPTFVCAGNHDRAGQNFEQFFGPEAYMFRFGLDGYLVFDTRDAVIASELGAQDGDLYRFRRAIRASRWSIGATHRYDQDMGMRAQLALFVDDPLDLLLAGHEHEAFDGAVPWGPTSLVLTPAAVNGAMRLIVVSDRINVNAGGIPPTPPAAK